MLHDLPRTPLSARLVLLLALGLTLAVVPFAASQGFLSTTEEPGEREGTTGTDAQTPDDGADDQSDEAEAGTRDPTNAGTSAQTPSASDDAQGEESKPQTPKAHPKVPTRPITQISAEPPSTEGVGAVTGIASPGPAPPRPPAPTVPSPTPPTPTVGATSTLSDPEAPIPAGAGSTAIDPEAPVPTGAGSSAPDPESPVAAGADAAAGPT